MLIQIDYDKAMDVNKYLKDFGMEICKDKICSREHDGTVTYVPIESDMTDYDNKMYRLAKDIARANSFRGYSKFSFSMYVGNIISPVTKALKDHGFIVTDYNVLVIKRPAFEMAEHINDLACGYTTINGVKYCLHKMMEYWPTTPVLTKATDRATMGEYLKKQKYMYHEDARVFQTSVHIPIEEITTSANMGTVEVRVLENTHEVRMTGYKYIIKVADYPPFPSDVLPTPDNLHEMIVKSNSFSYDILRKAKAGIEKFKQKI